MVENYKSHISGGRGIRAYGKIPENSRQSASHSGLSCPGKRSLWRDIYSLEVTWELTTRRSGVSLTYSCPIFHSSSFMSTNLALHLNHVAVSVSDIDAAVKWYTEVLGFRQLKPKVTLKRAEEPNGIIFRSKLTTTTARVLQPRPLTFSSLRLQAPRGQSRVPRHRKQGRLRDL